MDLSFDGTEYKLYQIHANGYMGILPDEWDDASHTMNDAGLVPYELIRNLTDREINERDLIESLCSTFATCISASTQNAVALKDTIIPYFSAVGSAAQASGKKALDFLKSPFFTQVAVGKYPTISSIVHLRRKEERPSND